MKNKVLKSAIAIMLIIALTIADFVLLGTNLVTYALENINDSTGNKNVKFAAYFKTEEEKVSHINYQIDNNQMRLYLSISVENEGYFDGVVTLNNANFKLKEEILSDKISKIEGNTITLKRIKPGATSTSEIEVGIEPISTENYQEDMLNKDSILKLTGNYIDNSEKSTSIDAEKKVTLTLLAPTSLDTTLESKVITNKVYNENGERLVQIELNSNVINNAYPVKSTIFEIELPKGAEVSNVISKGTYTTNGKADRVLEENNDYALDKNNNKLQVSIQNKSEAGKISWNKDAIDNVIVTLILPKDVEIGTDDYTAKAKVEFYGTEGKSKEKETKYDLTEEADGLITTSVESKENIYKGKLYSKEEREYNVTTNIEVNYANLVKESLLEEKTSYKTESESIIANTIEYKTTTIKKSELEKVLGKSGKLSVKNGQTIETITSQNEADENGNITITYVEGTTELQVTIIDPEGTGIIRLNNTKTIKADQTLSDERIDAFKYLVEESKITYSGGENKETKEIELKDVTSEATLTVPQTISTEGSQETSISLTLKSDNEKYELFKNPTFILTMPEGLTVNSVSDGTGSQLFGGLTISKLENNGKKIKIELSGAQTEYIESNINSQVNFIANISVEKLMPNKVDKIKMQYQNKGKTYNIESAPINIIASNSKIVTDVKIENYNGFGTIIEKNSDNTSEINARLPIENKDEIQATVTYTVINNYSSSINVNSLTLQAIYTDNEEKTTELFISKEQNTEIKAGEMKKVTRLLRIPANLYCGEKIDVKSLLEYNYFGTSYQLPNDLNLATEGKEGLRETTIIDNKLQLETFSQFGNSSAIKKDTEVYNEQIINYIIQVTNISNETLSNIVVTNKQTNGNIYDIEEVWVKNLVISQDLIKEHRYGELQTDTKTFEVETLKPGESKELLCRVVAKKVGSNSMTSANVSISINGSENNTIQTISNKVKESNMKIYSRKYSNEEVELGTNSTLKILSFVKNLTNSEINDSKARIYLSDGLSWNENYTVEAVDSEENEYDIIRNVKYNEEENYLEFDITKLEANQQITIVTTYHMKEIPLGKVSTDEKLHMEIGDIISNDVDIHIIQSQTKLSISQRLNIKENQKVKNNEKVVITGEITNIGNIDTYVTLEDYLPKGLEISKVEIIKKGETIDRTSEDLDNIVSTSVEIEKGEKIIINIEVTVNTSRITANELKNIIIAMPYSGDMVTSEEVTIQIESDVDTDTGIGDTDPDNPGDKDSENKDPDLSDDENPDKPDPDNPNPDNPNPDKPNPDKPDDGKDKSYTISGKVWVDKNNNGTKDNDEALKDVIVKVIDLNNKNNFLKDKDGNEIEVKTDKDGVYEIKDIPKGKYSVIFKYDTESYELKQTAEVKDYIIEDGKEKVAITNDINLDSDKTIDVELLELTEFNFKLDKYITKVIVQTANGTKTTEYAKKQLVREEIQRKYLAGATVLVEYTIDVSNIGELSGYATQIVDYMPKDMKFYSELNTQWYVGEDGNLYNTTLANSAINPGETKTVKLVLSKTMTKENTGTTVNTAEISELTNAKQYTDVDLTNNNSKAEIIVNPATGTIITYTLAIISSVTILVIGMYVIKKNVLGKEVR